MKIWYRSQLAFEASVTDPYIFCVRVFCIILFNSLIHLSMFVSPLPCFRLFFGTDSAQIHPILTRTRVDLGLHWIVRQSFPLAKMLVQEWLGMTSALDPQTSLSAVFGTSRESWRTLEEIKCNIHLKLSVFLTKSLSDQCIFCDRTVFFFLSKVIKFF